MNRVKAVISIVFCSLIITSLNVNVAQARDDWEYWGEYTLKFKLTDKLSFKIKPKIQHRSDFADNYYWESAQGFAYKLNKNFDIGLYYLYGEKDLAGEAESQESRVRTEVTWKTKLGDFNFSDRNRYEWRNIDGKPKSRYRNRIKLSKKTTVMGMEITPYVSNEFFYDFRKDEFNQNRGVFGFSKKLSERVKAGVYYMIKSSKSGSDWSEAHVVGSKFDVTFN